MAADTHSLFTPLDRRIEQPPRTPTSLPQTALAPHTFEAMPRRRVRLWAMRLTVLLGSLLFAVGIAELALHLTWDRPPRDMYMFDLATYARQDPDFPLRWLPKPNMEGVHPGFNAVFTTNSRGLRDREYAVPKPAGVTRVVVLGDSFTWGHGVSDVEVFSEIIESNVINTEVINLGVPGFELRSELRYLEREGMRYQPDVVIVAICQNDVIDFDRLEQRPAPAPSAPSRTPGTVALPTARAPFITRLRSCKDFLDENSDVYYLCRLGVNACKPLARLMIRLGFKEDFGGLNMLDDSLRPALKEYPPTVARGMERLKTDILRIDEYTRANGARMLIALVPALPAVDPRAVAGAIAYTRYDVNDFDLDKPYRLIEDFAIQHGILTCNPLQLFRYRHRAGDGLYLHHDMHFNAAGHRLFAEAMQPMLATMLTSIEQPSEPRLACSPGPGS